MKRATLNLMGNVKDLYLTCFPNENKRIVDYLFKSVLKPEKTIIEIMDNKVVSALSMVDDVIMINGRPIFASTIMMAATLPKYQNMGNMDKILNTVIDNLEHSELVSLVNTKNVDLFLKYGFRVLYRRNEYELTRDDVQRITNDGCIYDPSAIDMLKLYSSFMRRFNGYRIKTLEDFEKLRQGLNEQGGRIVAYYENNEIKGYAVMKVENKVIHIGECIYSDTLSLFKLLNVALQQRHTVYLNVSSAEKLDKLFPNAKYKVKDFMMMRLNNPELFNRLFNCSLVSVEEILLLSSKPLYISDLY